jgi:hypothetical protein
MSRRLSQIVPRFGPRDRHTSFSPEADFSASSDSTIFFGRAFDRFAKRVDPVEFGNKARAGTVLPPRRLRSADLKTLCNSSQSLLTIRLCPMCGSSSRNSMRF